MNSIAIFLIMIIVGCLISAAYTLLKLRSCVESLNMEEKNKTVSKAIIFVPAVMTSFIYGILISIMFISRPEISPEGQIRPLLLGIGGLMMVCAIIKGLIAGSSISKLAIDPTSRQLSLAICKIFIIELPQLIGLIILIYKVIG